MAAAKTDPIAPLTVTSAKAQICAILETLQKTGVMVRAIDIDWMAEVKNEDVEAPTAAIKCTVKLQADL